MRSESNWTGVTFGLALAAFAAYQQFKLPPALPLLLEQYGYGRTLAGGFMSIYAVAGLVLSMALGRAIERYGIAAPAMVALLLMLAGNAITLAVPQSGAVVLAARGFEGIAFAVLAIAGPVTANAHAGARHLPLVVALTAAWIPIGQLTAVLLARPSFVLLGWSGLWWTALAMTAALLACLARLRHVPGVELGPPLTGTSHDGMTGSAMPPERRGSLVLVAGIFMLWSGQYFAYMTWLPQYLVEALDLSVAEALWGYALPVGVLLLAILLSGRLLRSGVPVGPFLIAGLALQALTWALLPAAGGGALGILALILYGAGAGVVPTCLFAMPSVLDGHGNAAGSAFGIIMTGRHLGVLAGPIVLAQVFSLTGGWDWAAPLLGAVTFVALLLALWLNRRLGGAAYGTRR